ncbi:hypothetical protein AGMMS49593_02210 [Endomicrobiia bacterium]|nr:hypothetical protein AGMMS49593_02210 [Endomicrobiia bacterium]
MKLKIIFGMFVIFCFTAFILACGKYKLTSEKKNNEINQRSKQSSKLSQTHNFADKTLLSKTPTHGTILKETIDKETKAIILELSNGAKVILKNLPSKDKECSNDTIILTALAKGGTMAVTNKDDIPSVRFASDIIDSYDIWPYYCQDTKNKLSGKHISLYAHIDAFERSLQGHASLKDIITFFELIHLSFTSHNVDIGKFNDLIKSYKKDWADQNSELLTVRNELFYGNNPHFNVCGSNNQSRLDFLEATSAFVPIKYFKVTDYPKISQKTALEFVKKCFNPADFTFVFVGNIDTKVFRSYIKTYVASIAPSKALINQKFIRPQSSKWEIYMDNKFDSGVYLSWVIDEKYSPKIKVVSKVLEKYINIILDEPEKYCSAVYLNPFFDELSIDTYFSYDPKRIKERVSRVFKDIQNISEGDIDIEVLAKAKGAMQELHRRIKHYSIDAAVYADSYACSAVLHNSPLNEFDNFPFACQAVSKQDLKDLALRLLKGKYYQLIIHPKKT